jgi:hypothetical protein
MGLWSQCLRRIPRVVVDARNNLLLEFDRQWRCRCSRKLVIAEKRQQSAWLMSLRKLGCKATPRAVADWRDAFKGLPSADETGGIYRTMLTNENQFLGRGSERDPVHDEKLRSKLGRRIIETLRSFIVLARLTSTRKFYKIIPKLKFGPPQAS